MNVQCPNCFATPVKGGIAERRITDANQPDTKTGWRHYRLSSRTRPRRGGVWQAVRIQAPCVIHCPNCQHRIEVPA